MEGQESIVALIAQHGTWALVALLELKVVHILWKRYDEVQEFRIKEKESVVKALSEHTQLAERILDLVSRRKGG